MVGHRTRCHELGNPRERGSRVVRGDVMEIRIDKLPNLGVRVV